MEMRSWTETKAGKSIRKALAIMNNQHYYAQLKVSRFFLEEIGLFAGHLPGFFTAVN